MPKEKIFKALDRKFVEKLFIDKKKLFFPSEKADILKIEIERISPDWAKRTCLVRYKIFFDNGSLKIIRGTAKSDGSRIWSYKAMKYFYENGFYGNKFMVPRPLDYIAENGLFLYEEATGKPLSLIIDKNQYSPKFSKDIADLLFRIHSFKNINFERKALIFDKRDYLIAHQRIKKIFPSITKQFPIKKLHLIQNLNENFSFIHGDFYTGNIITNKNKLILIDFDKAGQGPILYDLASFCYCFEFPKSIWPLRLSEKDINNYRDIFLSSYAKMAGLDLIWLKGVLNKYMAKVFLNALNYYTGLAYEGWPVLKKEEKKVYFIQINDLLKQANHYLEKYENFTSCFRMRSPR